MSFFTGFGVSALVYFLLNLAFSAPGAFASFAEVDVAEQDIEDSDDGEGTGNTKKDANVIVTHVPV